MEEIYEQFRCECINAIRVLAADAIQKSNSGHPGLPLYGAATGKQR